MTRREREWTEVQVPSTNMHSNDGYALRYRARESGKEWQVKVVRPIDLSWVEAQDAVDSIQRLSGSLDEAVVDVSMVYENYDNQPRIRTTVEGWSGDVPSEKIDGYLRYRDKRNADLKQAERERAQKALEDIRKNHPDLLV